MAVINDDLLKMTVEITVATVGGGDNPNIVVKNTDAVTAFMQAVYDKLASLNQAN